MSKKTEKLRELKDAIQSSGLSLIPPDKMEKVPEDKAGFIAHFKKVFDPKNFHRPEYDDMTLDELKAKLKKIQETRARIGLPAETDFDKTLEKVWNRKYKTESSDREP
jgi:hypothetical protein